MTETATNRVLASSIGDLKLTQSAAILRHVARKAKLVGDTLEEQAIVDMLEQQAIDFRVGLTRRCYSDDYENLRGPYLAELDGIIKEWANYLGRSHLAYSDAIQMAAPELSNLN